MSRLPVTVLESRHLFYNLQQDLRKLSKDVFTELDGDLNNNNEEFESLWSDVDRELRAVYEMSRFALNVEELTDTAGDIDVFRGNCEDYSGIEPRNENLVAKINQETQDIENSIEEYAGYRVIMPMKIEALFMDNVEAKRKLFKEFEASPPGQVEPPSYLNDKLPAKVIGECLDELTHRLTQSVELVAASLGPMSEANRASAL